LASEARQAVGARRGAVGKPRTASAAVHRLDLWAGGLSTAGATAHPSKIHWVNFGQQGCVNSRDRQCTWAHVAKCHQPSE